MKVIYRWRDMIYAGGEFSFDKISKFSYPATSSRLRALTKVILMIYRYRDMISTSWMRGRFPLARKSKNALLIRRASRATFPDMGRLLLSELPSTDGKKAIAFS